MAKIGKEVENLCVCGGREAWKSRGTESSKRKLSRKELRR